jgi:hypothetical protein
LTENFKLKNPDYVARGLKAAMHNPNVSPMAKDHAAHQLEEMNGGHVRRQLGKKNNLLVLEWHISGT